MLSWLRKDRAPDKPAPAAAGGSAGHEPARPLYPRAAPRIETNILCCLLGQVRDISATGMRVTSAAAPAVREGDMVRLEVNSPKDELLVVGKVVRVRRMNHGGFDIGVQFTGITVETAQALESLARYGCIKGKRPQSIPGTVATIDLPDLYAILGVKADASDEQIQAAFRDLARKNHPDLNKHPEAQARFIELHKAYDVLKHPEKRKAYDEALKSRRAAA